MRRSISLTLILCLLLGFSNLAMSLESRRVLEHREDGAFLVNELGTGEVSSPADFYLRDSVLWSFNQGDIFYSTAIGNDAAVFAGSNAGLAMYDLYGDGTPIWNQATDTGYATAGAKMADLFASAVENEAISGAILSAWNATSSTPLWTKEIPGCAIPAECLRISDDGSRVVLGLNLATGGGTPTVFVFEGSTGDLISTYEGDAGTYIRALEISDDGSLVAIRASSVLHVVETETATLRWTGSAGASSDGLAFSGDGEWIASGWTFLLVWHWDGSSYQFAYSNNGGGTGWYLGRCAFDYDGNALIAGFYTTSYNQLKVMWFDGSGSTPIWTYNSPLSNGVYQEIPSAADMASDGQMGLLGSWGDAAGLNPEVHVFGPANSDPIYTVDTPGSVFSAACRESGGGIVGSSCGKGVHANEFGSGGDLYAFEVGPPTQAPEEIPGPALHMSAFPNPFNPKVTLSVDLSEDGPLLLEIYSPDGRKLREVANGDYSAGLRSFQWDGKNTAGQDLPSGVYLARAKSADREAMEKLVMLR
ncbi:hypothetical protein H8E52_10000 [bacterium]|nr:hypothetical protein [bacterium]